MQFLNKFKKYLLNPRLLIIYFGNRGIFNFLKDELYLKMMYRCRFSEQLDLNNPVTYNQKLQYLKLHDRNPEYCNNVDKYEVRAIIEKRIGSSYLVPILGIYENASQIPWKELPEQFVLKCTHGTHCSLVCKDKADFDIQKAEKMLTRWLKHNYYYDAREWPYKNIKPRVMIECFIDQSDNMMDVKFMCFSGKIKMIMVHRNIVTNIDHTINLFDENWIPLNATWGMNRYEGEIPKPANFEQICEIAEKLSEGCPHVRVDFMLADDKWYFGELTYYTAAGLKPFEDSHLDDLLGSWIEIGGVYERNRH